MSNRETITEDLGQEAPEANEGADSMAAVENDPVETYGGEVSGSK